MSQIVEARVENGLYIWTNVQMNPVVEEVAVEVVVDGKTVTEKRTVISFKLAHTEMRDKLSDVKATDTAGKEIPAEKLAQLLKVPRDVVRLLGPLSANHRSLFKDSTIFIELPPASPERK
jgi:hypothetical protein